MPLSTVTVTGSWKTPAPGITATGLVTVQPVTEAVGGGYILAGVPVRVRLTAGAINEVLVSNAEVTTLQYLVTERIDGAPVVQYVITPTGSTLDLSTAPRGTGPVIPLYLLASARGAANGVAPLDSGSHIPSQYLPSGSGVLSVTAGDATITIGGTGTDPTVAVAAVPAGQVTGLAASLAAKADLVAGKVPQAQIPAIALTDFLGAVASQAAMLALTGQRGDWATRTDRGTDWQLIADDPTQLGSWREMTYPASPVSSVAGRTGAVTLSKTDVGLGNVDNTSDLAKPVSTAAQTALDGKEVAGASAASMAAHLAASDPHPQYLTPAEGDAAYASLAALAGKENTGVAASLLAAHVAAADPHPQYLTQTEGDALYATAAAVAAKAAKPVKHRAYITTGDTTLPNTGGLWAPVPGFEITIAAVAGDDVEITFNGMRSTDVNANLDIAVIVGTSLVRFMASGTATPGFEGNPAWYPQNAFIGHAAPQGFVVTGGDLDGGVVRFVLAAKAIGTGTVYSSANYPFYWRVENTGQ